MVKIQLRCGKCGKLLGRIGGSAEIKCPRCGAMNIYDVDTRINIVTPKEKQGGDGRECLRKREC